MQCNTMNAIQCSRYNAKKCDRYKGKKCHSINAMQEIKCEKCNVMVNKWSTLPPNTLANFRSFSDKFLLHFGHASNDLTILTNPSI